MNDPKNLTILLLCVTASLLGAVLVTMHMTEDTALAATAESRAGDYVMASGRVTSSSDMLFLIDVASQRMNGYAVNQNNSTIELPDGAVVDLKVAFEGQQ